MHKFISIVYAYACIVCTVTLQMRHLRLILKSKERCNGLDYPGTKRQSYAVLLKENNDYCVIKPNGMAYIIACLNLKSKTFICIEFSGEYVHHFTL